LIGGNWLYVGDWNDMPDEIDDELGKPPEAEEEDNMDMDDADVGPDAGGM
jgi:hypothetical protein